MTVRTLGPQLAALLGMPKNVRSFELRCAVNEVVTVKCEYYPEGAAGFDAVLAEYEMVPRAGERMKAEAAPMHFDAWMRERTEAAHAAYMARHSAGGKRYGQGHNPHDPRTRWTAEAWAARRAESAARLDALCV